MKNYYALFIAMLMMHQLNAQFLSDFYFNILTPSNIYQSLAPGEYGMADPSTWGWDGTIPVDFTAELVYAPAGLDGLHTYCEEDTEDFTGKVVLIERGLCEFGVKALNAQNAGAVAVVLHNTADALITMAGGSVGVDVTIPVILIPLVLGNNLITEIDGGNTVTVGFTHSPNPFLKIDGVVKNDENTDCVGDANETNLQGWKVMAEGDNNYSNFTFTDENGYYQFYVDTGTYQIELVAPNPIWQTCPGAQVSSNNFDTITVDLQAQALEDCAVMNVDIEIPLLRRCFDNNTFVVDYCNMGTSPGIDAYITVQFDDLFTVVSASLPFNVLPDNTYEFVLGDVAPNDCGQFSITTELSCDAELGQTLCAVAIIYPEDDCTPTGSYAGPSTFVQGNCTGTEVTFTIENIGGEDMGATESYHVYKDAVLIESGSFELTAGSSDTYAFPADGATYRMEAGQVAGFPFETLPSSTIEACVNGVGTYTTGFFNMFPPADYGASYDEECVEVIGSWDPNDKTPTPLGFGDEHFIEQNVGIHYLVRFQNTGSDTAFNIIIRDTLSTSFDIASLEMGVSSYPYDFRLVNGNQLEFKFNNIMLPDSNVNEPASHGFLSYQLEQKEDVALGTVIKNSAAIYFDYNEAVITNETFHTIGEDFINTGNINVVNENMKLAVFPNPMNDYIIFDLENASFKTGSLELFDSAGKLVRVEQFEEPKFEVRRESLITGTYFFKVNLDGSMAASGMIQVVGK